MGTIPNFKCTTKHCGYYDSNGDRIDTTGTGVSDDDVKTITPSEHN